MYIKYVCIAPPSYHYSPFKVVVQDLWFSILLTIPSQKAEDCFFSRYPIILALVYFGFQKKIFKIKKPALSSLKQTIDFHDSYFQNWLLGSCEQDSGLELKLRDSLGSWVNVDF